MLDESRLSPDNGRADAVGAASGLGQQAPRRSARRRLWQLPTQAHELLLGLSFPPEALRRELARTLGRVHKGRCVLKGRDVDVLYSAVHDMTTRNPLSEALNRLLDERHAAALRRLAPLRDLASLDAAWADALADDTVPSALWAVLTHPLGPEREAAVLYDARFWVFTHARRSVDRALVAVQAHAELLQARQRADALQTRLLAQQRQAAEASERAQAEIARLQGELARLRAPEPASTALVTPARDDAAPRPVARCRPIEEAALPTSRVPQPASADTPGHAAAPVPRQVPARPASEAVLVRGRRVLCVGGIKHAVARYRRRIEQLGGQFAHHDGGIEESVQALEARLNHADLVICQAACINHEAYHRVKRHCERTGTPCVYLDRPSLSRLDRALGQTQGAPS
jgi:hypothetical protein